MTSVGTPFLERPDLNLFISDKSLFQNVLQSLIAHSGDQSHHTRQYHLLQQLKESLLFRKDTTFYGLNMDDKIEELVALIEQARIPEFDTPEKITTIYVPLAANIVAKMRELQQLAENLTIRPTLEDLLYFDYARNGEASLNQEVSRLGDALIILNKISKELNRIEGVLAINPGKGFINERGELLIKSNPPEGATAGDVPYFSNGSTSFFYNLPVFLQAERKYANGSLRVLNAIQVLEDAANILNSLMLQVPTDSDHHKAIEDIVWTINSGYGIGSWPSDESRWADRLGGDTTKGELYWKTDFGSFGGQPKNFARLYMDNNFRKNVSDALSTVQSQNDIQKQILSKSLFLYQEFIKSSSSLLDITFKCSKSAAQKMAR